MTAPWLTLVGIGEDGILPPSSQHALESAQVVYGGARHFELTANLSLRDKRLWPSPFSKVFSDLKALEGTATAILATGDPQWFGIGASLAKRFPQESLRILPALSAFQMAASRMTWSLQDVHCISLHGRPTEILFRYLQPGLKMIALTSNGHSPTEIAAALTQKGYGRSEMTVLEHLGGERESQHTALAEAWQYNAQELNTVAIEITAADGTPSYASTPGLPDAAFEHDGKMTKQDLRAVTLAALQPLTGSLLWDIGAGCGSIGIEWLRCHTDMEAIGLEPNETRRQIAVRNALALGVPHLELRPDTAPEGLSTLPDPDAIFIGGGLTTDQLIPACLARLKPAGRLVANAVTLEGEAKLLEAFQRHGGSMIRIAVQHADPVGNLTGWRSMMPVTQWRYIKPMEGSTLLPSHVGASL